MSFNHSMNDGLTPSNNVKQIHCVKHGGSIHKLRNGHPMWTRIVVLTEPTSMNAPLVMFGKMLLSVDPTKNKWNHGHL